MGHKYRLFALLTSALVILQPASVTAADDPPGLNLAQKLVLMNDYLSDVAAGSVLSYDFTSSGKGIEPISDTVKIKVVAVHEDGRRDLEFEFLTGANRVEFHPARAYKGNPVTIHFLERDIREMSQRAEVNGGFLKNRIRSSFSDPEIQPVTIDFQGRQLPGTSITVTPFVGAPTDKALKTFADKRYSFLFSDQIPGGVYEIHTVVPDANGTDVLIDEKLTFHDVSVGQ